MIASSKHLKKTSSTQWSWIAGAMVKDDGGPRMCKPCARSNYDEAARTGQMAELWARLAAAEKLYVA